MKSKNKYLMLTAIAIGCLIAISCGPKKKVTKFEKPKSILFAKSSFEISVYKKLESSDKPVGEIKEADLMSVNAQIEITRKDKSTVTYFEIKCPPKFKEGCGENEAYINGSEILGSSLSDINSGQVSYAENMGKAILVEADLINDAATTRDWITNPAKKDKVNVISDALFLAIAALVKNADDRSQILSELLMLGELVKDPAYTDSRYDAVFKKYAVLNKRKEGEEPRVTGLTNELITTIRTYNDAGEKKIITGFPMRSQSYKGLVDQFNRLKKIPFIQERILQEVLKNSKYTLAGTDSDLKIEILGKDGVKVSFTNAGAAEENTIESITALEDNGSIGFTLKLKDKEISISPAETPSYLLAGGPGLKEFVSQIPKDYREVMKNNEYYKGVMLTALKFGDGGFDEATGMMKYQFQSSNKYWTTLEIFRLHPNLTRKGDYSGEFVHSYTMPGDTCGSDKPNTWRQPKGQLYIGQFYKQGCDGTAKDEFREEICMNENGSEGIDITFSPSEIRSEKPNIQLNFWSNSTGFCTDTINELFGSSGRAY